MAAPKINATTILPAALLFVRLAVVAAYPWLARQAPAWAWANNDGYDAIAVNWVETGVYGLTPGLPTAARLPLYPGIIAAAYLLAGAAYPTVVMVLQALLSFATGVALFRMTERLFDRPSARVALGGFILHPQINNFIFRCATETLFIFLVTMLISSATRYARGRHLRDLVCLAVWLGLSLLTRPTLAPLAAWSAPLLLLGRAGSRCAWRRRCGHAAAAAGIVGLLLAPWLIRNGAGAGYPPPLQTWSGRPLYQGTHVSRHLDEFLRREKTLTELDAAGLAEVNGAIAGYFRRRAPERRPLAREAAADRYAGRRAYRRLRENPRRALAQFLRNLPLTPVLQMTWSSTAALMAWNGPMTALSLAGMGWCFRVRRAAFFDALPLTAVFFYLWFTHALVWPQARYLLPGLAPFSSFAAFGLTQLFARRGITAIRDADSGAAGRV